MSAARIAALATIENINRFFELFISPFFSLNQK